MDAPHPTAEAEADPCADGGADGGYEEAAVEGEAVIGLEELAQAVVAAGAGVVVEVDGAEEAVLAGLGHEEVGEGPLDGDEDGDEEEAGDEGDLPGLPGAGALPEEIERERGNDDEDGKLGRDHVGDGIEDGAEFGLRREEREDEDLGDGEEGVDGGGGGRGPAVARGLRQDGEDDRQGDAHGDVGGGGVEDDVPGVLHEEEHLAGDDEAAGVEEEALEGFEVGWCRIAGVAWARFMAARMRKRTPTATARMPRMSRVWGGLTILTSRP